MPASWRSGARNNASRNDAAVHDRFWADELVYTGSNGRRRNKSDVMHDVRAATPPKPGDPTTTYTAEDVRIQQYGNTAIVAFRLVGTSVRGGATQVAHFLNTGTFIKRNNKWQVVAWQATKEPKDAADVKKEVAVTEAAFQNAFRTADLKTLESLTDENFVWMQDSGEQITRKQLLERLSSGQLKYSKLDTSSVTVTPYPDVVIVRGVSTRQRSAVPAATAGDTAPFTAFYTLTFINQAGVWKAVAMHSSRAN